MLVPTNVGVGLNAVALGLVRAIDNHGVKVAFYKPVAVSHDVTDEDCDPYCPLSIREVESYLSEGREGDLLEDIVGRFEACAENVDVIVIQGMIATQDNPYVERLNRSIAKALDANVILVATPANFSPRMLSDHIEITAQTFGGIHHKNVLGCIINKVGGPVDEKGSTRFDLAGDLVNNDEDLCATFQEQCPIFSDKQFRLLGCIPWKTTLSAPRIKDIVNFLKARLICPGEFRTRRVSRISLCARSVSNMLGTLKPGSLIITSGDRTDIIIATALISLSGVQIAGLLLTGDYPFPQSTFKLCEQAILSGLPILSTRMDSYRTVVRLHQLDVEVAPDDEERIEASKDYMASYIDSQWIKQLTITSYERHLSPPAFRYQLVKKARSFNKVIVLPEGDEPRTVRAAIICGERNIARCVLLAENIEVERIAKHYGLSLNENVSIISPDSVRERYIDALVEIRKNKGMTAPVALEQLQDNVMLGTMMLQCGRVDGLVSGALHTTANTIRPAFQIIKTAPDAKLVSSIFFMCLPDQVLVYGDCAVNPDPTPEELADIAIQSANSAQAFNITPRVAMISYSTGTSGSGSDVEKVRQATHLVKQKRPDLLVDGPLQYDAALIQSVAKSKAPDSPVAGQATVVIFPDLNTGNTTYKAVQRSADVLSIGPMLQGLNKPVNDLSRGATVDDIVYTIAITAIQAGI